MLLLIALSAGATVCLLAYGVLHRNPAPSVRRRVDGMRNAGEPVDPYEASFNARVLQPAARRIAALVGALLPTHVSAAIRERLTRAGLEMPVTKFVAGWVAFATAPPMAIGTLSLIGGTLTLPLAGLLTVWLGMGSYVPWLLLRRKGQRRVSAVDRALPDAVDLIVTGLEAGLSLQSAMLTLAVRAEGPIGDEFRRMARETSLGRARAEALTAMAERTGSREMRLLVRAIVQAELMGLSIGPVLRNQARDARTRRQQLAREQAGKIPVKITIPTVMFMFPTLFLLLLTPVALRAMETFGGK